MDVLDLIYTFSYFGFFILGFLSTAAPISPPLYLSLPLILHITNLNALLATILTALGMTVGELIPYYIGYVGEELLNEKIKNNPVYRRFSNILNKYGIIALPIIVVIPFPFFDAAAALYGFAKIDIKTFFILVFVGKLVKTSFVVILGYYALIHLF